MKALDPHHIERRDAVRDRHAHGEFDPRIGSFHNGIGGEWWWHEHDGVASAPVFSDGFFDRVSYTGRLQPPTSPPPRPGVTPADDTLVPYSNISCV